MGLDGTGPDSFQEVLDFSRESGLYEVQVTIQTAFPATPLYDRLKKSGRLIDETAWEMCTLFDVNFHPDGMTAKELEDRFLWLVQELYSAEETKARRSSFFDMRRELKHEAYLHVGGAR